MSNLLYTESFVSVICAAYNAEKYIHLTIESIINQTYRFWELIVIDDCSHDDTCKIVEKYSRLYPNIILIKNEKNLGPGVSRNNGIAAAKGRYIAICDSDDIWYPQKMELQLKYMQSNNIPISYTSYELINSQGEKLHHTIKVAKAPIGYTDYLKNTIIGFSTSMIDRKLCPNIVLSDLRSREDTLLWCTLLKEGYKAYGLALVLVKYRIHNSSVSANKIKASMQVWYLYRKRLHIPLIKCLYYFSCYAMHAVMKRFF